MSNFLWSDLSLDAIGALGVIQIRFAQKDFTAQDVASWCKENQQHISQVLKELESKGFVAKVSSEKYHLC